MQFNCDSGSLSKGMEAAFVNQMAAPSRSGVQATAMVHLRATAEMVTSFGATYLAAELPGGWCLVDVVLGWDNYRAYFDTDFQLRWRETAAPPELDIQAHRVAHESLDAEESAAGVSDVTHEHCERITYRVVGGAFERMKHESSQGACPEAKGKRD
jgi:hypothetical protein